MTKAEYEANRVFRGKRHFKGKWVYGYLIYVEGTFAYIIPEAEVEAGTPVSIGEAVIYENQIMCEADSLSEWTGLHDTNGIRIFEGDIIHLTYSMGVQKKPQEPIKKTVPYNFDPSYPHVVSDCKGVYFQVEIVGNIFEQEETQ